MRSVSRLAIGTIQPDSDLRPMLWALLEALRQQAVQVQSFLSRACFSGFLEQAAVTGVKPRHLDSWLMSPEFCRQSFLRGTESCDLAVVEGSLAPADAEGIGASLPTLCQWLDLPRLAVLDVSRLEDCRWPERPERLDGLLLDRVGSEADFARWSTNLETLWGVPVLGALGEAAALRAEIQAMAAGTPPSALLCQRLQGQFVRYGDPQRVLEIAARRSPLGDVSRPLCRRGPSAPRLVVALAYDRAFNCYFPDTLEGLESSGATIVDFSPLRHDRLPAGADVVYFGCGHPENHAAELSHNHCMKLALRHHLRRGGRLYAEGGGLAYLCQHLATPETGLVRMAGIFPAIAWLERRPTPARPLEVTLGRATWLGQAGTKLRGYSNPQWRLEPVGRLADCVLEPDHRFDLVGIARALGSQLHLNFAALPELLGGLIRGHFHRPHPVDPWSAVP
jgi:cobyrinic acid a,c-diamide synthase